MKRNWWIFALTLAVVALCTGAVFFVSFNTPIASKFTQQAIIKTETTAKRLIPTLDNALTSKSILPVLTLSGTSEELLNIAFKDPKSYPVAESSRILLVPHYLVAAREIATTLSSVPRPSKVFFIMPDHFARGKTSFTTSLADWDSIGGRLSSESDIIDKLVKSIPELSVDNTALQNEMAFQSLAPYIAKAWGNDVQVIPIMTRLDTPQNASQKLAFALADEIKRDPQFLLLSTVDFSHFQTAEVADFHDELALDVITSLADLETDKIEMDSPATLAVTLKTARELGLGNVQILAHTNSLRLQKAIISTESTSYIFAAFAPGQIQTQQNLTLLFLGDIMLDRNVAARNHRAGSLEYPFALIRGQEDRFFKGQDLVIANLEGPVTTQRNLPDKGEVDFAFAPDNANMLKRMGIDAVSQANNHTLDQGRSGAVDSIKNLTAAGIRIFGDQVKDDADHALSVFQLRGQSVALIAWNTTDNPLDKSQAGQVITQAKTQAQKIMVFMHWGNEYQSKPNSSQTEFAHWLIDQGVDAVIGSHPHWMQSVEVYKNHAIVYSLGNFIFDQDWSKETQYGLIAGLSLSKEGSKLYLYPISITKSQPQLLTGADRQTRLDFLSQISDPALSSDIKNGVLKQN